MEIQIVSQFFLGIDGLTGILILDFHKDWQRRVRVHFDQVRIRKPISFRIAPSNGRLDTFKDAQLRTERPRILMSVHGLTLGIIAWPQAPPS
jgi:hypothetical protein